MTRRIQIAVALCVVCAGCVFAADNDETAYSSRAYAPRKSGNAKTYQASTYKSARAPRTVGKPLTTSPSKRRWNPFRRNKTLEDAPRTETPKRIEETPYQQQKHIAVSTLKPDPNAVQERKPFVASEKDVPNAGFTPAEKSGWKNPMLKPRQGIKDTAE